MSHGGTVIILDDKTDKILVLLFKYKPLAGGRSKASGSIRLIAKSAKMHCRYSYSYSIIYVLILYVQSRKDCNAFVR